MDLAVKSTRIPAIGEIILGEDFIMAPCGKEPLNTLEDDLQCAALLLRPLKSLIQEELWMFSGF